MSYLIKFSLSVLSFMFYAFGVTSPSPQSPILSSRSLVLCFTIGSVTHFELILVKDVRPMSGLIFFFACEYMGF